MTALCRQPLLHTLALVAVLACGRAVAAAPGQEAAAGYELKEFGRIEFRAPVEAKADIAPDGESIAAAIKDVARVYRARTHEPLTPELPHGQPITRIEFGHGGARVLTVSEGYARVWDSRTGQRLSPRLRHGKDTAIATAALSPDGRRLLTVAAEPPGPPGIVVHPVNAPAPKVTDEQGEVRVWDVQTGELVLALPHPTFVQCALFSPDGSRILTASTFMTGAAYLWNAADGKPVCEPIEDVLHGNPTAIFSADGSRFALNCWYKAQVHAADTGKHLRTIGECASRSLPTSVAISPDGKAVYRTDQSTHARSWDVETGKLIARPMEDLSALEGVRFSPDGKRMFVPGYDPQGAGVRDGHTGSAVWVPPETVENLTSARFLPDGSVALLSARFGGVEEFRLERTNRD